MQFFVLVTGKLKNICVKHGQGVMKTQPNETIISSFKPEYGWDEIYGV